MILQDSNVSEVRCFGTQSSNRLQSCGFLHVLDAFMLLQLSKKINYICYLCLAAFHTTVSVVSLLFSFEGDKRVR